MPKSPHLPQVLWRVSLSYPNGARYGDPTGKTFADERHARALVAQAERRGAVARIFRTETDWQETSDA